MRICALRKAMVSLASDTVPTTSPACAMAGSDSAAIAAPANSVVLIFMNCPPGKMKAQYERWLTGSLPDEEICKTIEPFVTRNCNIRTGRQIDVRER